MITSVTCKLKTTLTYISTKRTSILTGTVTTFSPMNKHVFSAKYAILLSQFLFLILLLYTVHSLLDTNIVNHEGYIYTA